MTGAAITANLMRNNSFRVDSVQKLLGPHKFSQCLERETSTARETDWKKRSGRGGRREAGLFLLLQLPLFLLLWTMNKPQNF